MVSDEIGQFPFVRIVGKGPKKRDSNRLDAAVYERLNRPRNFFGLQPDESRTLVVDALGYLFDQRSRDDGVGLALRRGAKGLAFGEPFGGPPAHDQQRIAESLRRQQSGLGSRPSNKRVIGNGAGVEKKFRGAQEFVRADKAKVARRVAYRVDRADGKIIGSR